MKTAIVLGATGLTGGLLLKELLEDNRYSKVKVFTRKTIDEEHQKLEQYVEDLLELEKRFLGQEEFRADEIFVCIGTTKAKTPDLELYHKIDYGIPVSAARLAKKNGIPKILVVSAMGADPKSRIFYNRTKGEMERDVLKAQLPYTYFFQPSLIAGNRKESRFFEAFSKVVMKVLNPLLRGSLKKYRSIHPETIARAMVFVANNGFSKKRIESDEIKVLAKEAEQKS